MSVATQASAALVKKAQDAKAGPPKEREAPDWYQEYRQTYQAGVSHAFILSGDTEGTAYEDASQRTILEAGLAKRFDVVAKWHLASGGVVIYGPDDPIADENTGAIVGTRKQIATKIVRPDVGSAPAAAPTGVSALAAKAGPQASAADPFKNAQQPLQALALLQTLLTEGWRGDKPQGNGNVAVIIDYADTVAPAPAMAGKGAMGAEDRKILVTLLSWAKDRTIDRLGNCIFLIARDREELHPDLRTFDSGWRSITIEPPLREARAEFLDWYQDVRARQRKPIALKDKLTTGEIAGLTAGLNLRNLEDILLSAYREGGLDRANLKKYKDRIVKSEYSEVAEMIDPLPGGFRDLGGAEVFKSYANRRIIKPIREGRSNSVPRGIVLVGPPGTGKTIGVRGLAGEISFTAVALNAAKILGGIVGQSERNLDKFLSFCRALAPVIVFVDEFDQTDMAQRGDQSGNPVAKNLFNALMQFMSDETLRGKVIVILASNRPDKIDPAMKRSGRIDAILPMLLPGKDDRKQIAAVQARIQGITIDDDALEYIAANSDNWNGGDLAEVIREARLAAEDDRLDTISLALAKAAMYDLMPAGLDTAEQFTRYAIQAVNKRSLLPAEYAEKRQDEEALAREILDNQPVGWESEARGERDWPTRR